MVFYGLGVDGVCLRGEHFVFDGLWEGDEGEVGGEEGREEGKGEGVGLVIHKIRNSRK